MKRKIRLHKDKETGEYYFKMRALLYGTGIKMKEVDTYNIKLIDNDTAFIVKLFDKDGNNLLTKKCHESKKA